MCSYLYDILYMYEAALRQMVNFAKCNRSFSSRVPFIIPLNNDVAIDFATRFFSNDT